MRKRPSILKSSVFTGLVLLGSTTVVFAENGKHAADAKATPAAAVAPAPATPAPVVVPESPAPTVKAPEPAQPAEEEVKVAPDSPAVTEIGVQRLPGTAYPSPQIRGIPYGSLGLTFHGLQWPYMPATGPGKRFVIGLSGWGWVDNAYQKFAPWGKNPNIDSSRIKYWKQQARLVLRATPTYSFDNNYFVQGQAEFVATMDQTITRNDVGGADTDDLWLRFGQWNKWDFMIGRYEGWEVFHLGMGLDQNTFERKGAYGDGDKYPANFYGVSDNQFRPQGAAGNVAFHYYPTKYLRFELLSTLGSIGSSPVVSTRPVAILDLGWVKLKAATEYQRLSAQQADDKTKKTSKGIGGAIQFIPTSKVEFGFNMAQGTIWSIASDGKLDPRGSLTRTSYGGFANVWNGSHKHPVVLGLGSIFTHYVDQNNLRNNGKVDDYWHLQSFVAAQYIAFEQLYIKLIGGYARGHWETADPYTYDDEMYSVRLRFSFYF